MVVYRVATWACQRRWSASWAAARAVQRGDVDVGRRGVLLGDDHPGLVQAGLRPVEGGLLDGAPRHPAVELAAVGLHLDDAVPLVRVGPLAARDGPRLPLAEELVGVVGQVHADVAA